MVAEIDTALASVMNARAAGLAEQQLIFNPSPEIDSLVEEIVALPIDTATQRRLLGLLRDIAALNASEGNYERSAAGTLDELLTVSRRSLTSQPRGTTLSVKTIASLLRPAIRHGGPPLDIIVAGLLTRVPRSTLLGRGLRGELGAGPFADLTRVVERVA